MARYMVRADYGQDSMKGLLKEGGTARQAVVKKAVEALGGKLECFYWAIGESDLYGIIEMPDSVSAQAFLCGVRAASPFAFKTSVLLTAEEMDEVAKKSTPFRGPGQ